jgi:hypothetical protein
MTEVVSLISVVIALAAVYVAIWQVRENARNVAKSNSLPVLSQIARTWRSSEMRGHRDRLLRGLPAPPDGQGFAGLPDDFRDSAEQFCFFCEGLGLASLAKLVPEDFIISLMGTQIVEVWRVMEPHITDERDYRARVSAGCVPSEFLPHYEHLVARILESGGREAGAKIRRNLGVRRLPERIGERAAISSPPQSEDQHTINVHPQARSQLPAS